MKSTYLAGVAEKRSSIGRTRLDGFRIAALIFEVIDVCSLTKLSLDTGSLSIPNVCIYIAVLF